MDVPGYTRNIYIIPDSNSAVVVLSNRSGLGDATDRIAQNIIQTISGLEPKVDVVPFLEVVLDPEDPANLQMMFNGCLDQALPLRHYNHDVFSYLPGCYDECLKRELDWTQWSAFLISFLRDDQEGVKGVCWKLDGVDTFFSRRG